MSEWSGTDWVGIYGAILATLLGLTQWVQWKKSQNLLIIVNTTVHEFGRQAAMTSDLEITVTNRSNIDIFIHSCWAGYSQRPWTTPWRRETVEAFSVTEIDQDGYITGKPAGYLSLAPGKRAQFHVDRSKINKVLKPSWRYGFAARKCFTVDHSGSSESTFMFDL